MAETQAPKKSVALICNSSLPAHLGKLSNILATDCRNCYCRRDELTIDILDIADYDIPSLSSSSTAPDTTDTPAKKPLSEWQSEIARHSGFILLFPYHIWAHCNSIKNALSESIFPREEFPHVITRKPVLLVGFGKEDLWRPNKLGTGYGWTQRIWSRKSFPMMRDWALEQGMKPMPPQIFGFGEDEAEFWPEFNCFDDYWRTWEKTGEVVIGGQQDEAWESPGYNRCQQGMRKMVEVFEGKKGT